MRPTFVRLAAFALLAGCAPMPGVVYTPAPAPALQAAPPVGVTIVDAADDRVLVSTNQPAHVAVFEIVQGRGVRLVYPVSPTQRRVAQSGSGWLTIAAPGSDDRFVRGDRYDRVERPAVRYLYALASERPLRITDPAFDDEWLGTMLGARAARAADPYETIQAIARRFLPPVPGEEEWGEDLYRLEAVRRGPSARIARVYCPDGSIVYVRDDVADRGGCPWGGRNRGREVRATGAPRPDSVVSSTGRHVASRPGPRLEGPVSRVPHPAETGELEVRQAGSASGSRPADAGARAHADSASARQGGKEERDEHHDNGRHNGWDRGAAKGDEHQPVEQKPAATPDSQTKARPADGVWGRMRPIAPTPTPTDRPVAKPDSTAPARPPREP